jgi:hypothetical protein
LTARRTPYEICNLLTRDNESPFYKLIKRSSDKSTPTAVVNDSSVMKMIRNSINNPLGALAPYRSIGRDAGDVESMYRILITFWKAVKDVFPEAWGQDPRQSRLMHSVGIEAMGVLMDKIYARLSGSNEDYSAIRRELEKIAPDCKWTSGTWESLGIAWNEIQNTPRDIKKLQDTLVRLYTSSIKK